MGSQSLNLTLGELCYSPLLLLPKFILPILADLMVPEGNWGRQAQLPYGCRLDGLRPAEEGAVHGVNDGLSTDLSATKETAVEALDSVLSALDAVKLQVDVARGIGV